MPAVLKALSLLPELIRLCMAYSETRSGNKRPTRKELKKELSELEKAMRDGDQKKLNDIINNL